MKRHKRTDPKDIKLDDSSCIAVLGDDNWRDSCLSWHPQLSDSITGVIWLQQLDGRYIHNECFWQLRLSVLTKQKQFIQNFLSLYLIFVQVFTSKCLASPFRCRPGTKLPISISASIPKITVHKSTSNITWQRFNIAEKLAQSQLLCIHLAYTL